MCSQSFLLLKVFRWSNSMVSTWRIFVLFFMFVIQVSHSTRLRKTCYLALCLQPSDMNAIFCGLTGPDLQLFCFCWGEGARLSNAYLRVALMQRDMQSNEPLPLFISGEEPLWICIRRQYCELVVGDVRTRCLTKRMQRQPDVRVMGGSKNGFS